MSSLCETCDKEMFFKCPWVMCQVPILGWVARKVRCKEGGNTYKVFECPKYKPESSNKARCRICGKVLEGKRNKYCSKECADKGAKLNSIRGRDTKKCTVCGKNMPFKKHKYCSEECKKLQVKLDAQKRRVEKWLHA